MRGSSQAFQKWNPERLSQDEIAMSYAPRQTGFPSHVRAASSASNANAQSSVLQTRINEKKLELESLKQLRDLSAGLADQMQQLEEKLTTLSDGTEAVAAVMANWNTILRAIHLASAKIPKPKDDGVIEAEPRLPQTLVRIPIQQAEAAQREVGSQKTGGGE